MRDSTTHSGFTLIELSVVLVIIGLIVGGVMVGRDLINASKVRATVSQLEKFKAATNVFSNKYNGLPGDLFNSANYFAVTNGWNGLVGNGNGLGNGNGNIESWITFPFAELSGEPIVYWGELSAANLIGDTISSTALNYTVSTDIPSTNLLPAAKLGGGNYFAVEVSTSTNYFILGKVTSTPSGATLNYGLTPWQAYQIDIKIDDGSPSSGDATSISRNFDGGGVVSSPGANKCASATGIYDIVANPNTVECVLGIRARF